MKVSEHKRFDVDHGEMWVRVENLQPGNMTMVTAFLVSVIPMGMKRAQLTWVFRGELITEVWLLNEGVPVVA